MSADETLALLNPWWEGRRSPVVESWEGRRVRWRPKWIEGLSLEPFSLNVVIGPRLVGKTTGLHILIEEELRRRDALSILYLNLDLAPTFESFKALLDTYLRIRKARALKSCLIVLDEVTSVPGWWRLVKGYVDAGSFRNDVLILSGSSSLRLKGEVELLPGRMGKGKELSVLPLSFREYLSVMGVEVEPSEDPRNFDILLPQASKIRSYFRDYLRTGGFPLPLNSDPSAAEQLIRSIEGEILRVGRSLDIAISIISQLLRAAPSPISFNSVASQLSISHRTVREYVEFFSALMVLGQALYFDGSPKFRKERKFFIRDPFLAKALSIWTSTEFLESALYEWVVQEHLLRKHGSVYYWRDSYEIDAIAGELKIEVKAGKPHRRYPKGVTMLSEDDIPLFLALI
jgi:predicted AAA+ superfamily ATPase